ncbi:MAG: hypothetical protein WDM80_15800 [Limisphaerales bacterium]
MQSTLETPKASKLHHSMAFIISGDLLRKLIIDVSKDKELCISFAKFVGTKFSGMPRPDVNYYPVLAMFRLPAGRRFRTFDKYQVEGGTSVLIYPVYRKYKAHIRKALIDQVIPALRIWCKRIPSVGKTEVFYALYDQTFDELVFGPNQCIPANRRQVPDSTHSNYSVISFMSHVHSPMDTELGY